MLIKKISYFFHYSIPILAWRRFSSFLQGVLLQVLIMISEPDALRLTYPTSSSVVLLFEDLIPYTHCAYLYWL